jgi:hypothetical protein
MRQRDREERLALAGLHDGDPGPVDRMGDTQRARRGRPASGDVLEQAVAEWARRRRPSRRRAERDDRRDNDDPPRAQRARARPAREQGALGDELVYGPVAVAVGDRVICRNNERDLDVDNGTRGTVRHIDAGGS